MSNERRRERDGIEVDDLHEPIYREHAEPRDGYEPPPIWLWFFVIALMGFGGWYLGTYSGGFDAAVYDEREMARGPVASQAPTAVDPMVLGRRVYNNCSACHQQNGAGVSGNYPPLDGSQRVQGRPDVLAAILLHGLEGPLELESGAYNQVMPPWGHLSDEQLAAVLTYIRGSWTNQAPPVETALVAAVRERTGGRSRSLTAAALAELEQAPATAAASAPAATDGV